MHQIKFDAQPSHRYNEPDLYRSSWRSTTLTERGAVQFHELFAVRLCTSDDAKALALFVQALIIEEGNNAPPDLDPLTDLIHALLTSGFSDFIIAEQNGQHVGCLQINYRLSTHAAAPYAVLEDLYVAPEARKQGIGASMLDYACQRAAGQGCAYIEAQIHPDNQAAISLHRRQKLTPNPSMLMRRHLH
jgi:ribosomal protein S18 acetylase RimI-like enzyme